MSDSSLWNEKYTSAKLAALAVTSGFRIFKVMELIFPLYVETFMLALAISLHSLWPKSSFHVLITYTCWQTKSSFQCGFFHFTVRKNESCSACILIRCLSYVGLHSVLILCSPVLHLDSVPHSLQSAVFYNIVFTQDMPQKVKQEKLQVKKKSYKCYRIWMKCQYILKKQNSFSVLQRRNYGMKRYVRMCAYNKQKVLI